MFQSPLKTVSEKIKPASSKSSISSLKFDRVSDFKKFINFLKKETKELEKIKIPKVSEVKGKSKRKGFLGLAALGIFGLLGLGFGDDDGEEKKRFGLAGGTESQFKDIGLPLIRGLKNVKDTPPRFRRKTSRVGRSIQKRFSKGIRKQVRTDIAKTAKGKNEYLKTFKKRLLSQRENLVAQRRKQLNLKKMEDVYKKEQARRDKIITEMAKLEEKYNINITDSDLKKIPSNIRKQYNDLLASIPADPEIEQMIQNYELGVIDVYSDADYRMAENLIQQEAAEYKKLKEQFVKDLKQQKKLAKRVAKKTTPNVKIPKSVPFVGGFSPKDTLDKMFTGIGQKTKTFRDSLSAGFSKIPIPKKVVSIAKPFLKKGAFVFDFATAGIELYKILEGFVVGDNILTSFYDLGVSIHNTFQPDKTKLITYITNSRDSRLRAITDQKNQKISNQIQQAQQAKASNNNVSPSNPTSNIIPFAKKTGMDMIMVPMYPQFTGFKFVMDKLYRQ